MAANSVQHAVQVVQTTTHSCLLEFGDEQPLTYVNVEHLNAVYGDLIIPASDKYIL